MSAVLPPPVRPPSSDGGSDGPGGGSRGRSGAPSRRVSMIVLVAAVVALVASVTASPWIVRGVSRAGAAGSVVPMGGGMMGGTGTGAMMPGRVWLAGDGVAVASIAAARARASEAASAAGLRPGEVVQFSRNVYVELKDSAGASVTEVLVDPADGAVTTEPGPAMMWNTGSRTATVTTDQARSLADAWLQADRPGESVTSVDAYPGYCTLDTAAAGRPVGMLSVNATTGEVWYHTWHGTFLAKEDA